MHTDDRRFETWLDLIGDLMRQPLTSLPRMTLLRELSATFQEQASWHWLNADGSFGFELSTARPGWPGADELAFWRRAFPLHPLIRWYSAGVDPAALSIGRVPRQFAPPPVMHLLREHLGPLAIDQQLSIPYWMGDGSHRAFVLARTGADFDTAQLTLARRLQPLLALLGRQVSVLEPCAESDLTLQTSGLSGRELAVLQLLSEGHTATAIAFRLGISPRTVHKHLEHIYRKLRVVDRLLAVRVAHEQGLLRPTPAMRPQGGENSVRRSAS